MDVKTLDRKLAEKCANTIAERSAHIYGVLRVNLYDLFISLVPVECLGENKPDQNSNGEMSHPGWFKERFVYDAFRHSVCAELECKGLKAAVDREEVMLYVFDPSRVTLMD